MPITSGSIEYERRLNLGEYNHKNVVAKVSWTVEPGEIDGELAIVAIDKAVMRVKNVLNWKPPTVEYELPSDPVPIIENIENRNIENKAAPNLAVQHPVAEITAGIPPALKRHRRTKAEMDAARAAAEAGKDPVTWIKRIPSQDETLADLVETTAAAEPGMPSFDPEPAPLAEVTDQALLDACQAKASSGKSVAGIKELVAKFSAGGLVQTPQDARRRFLDDLAKL